MKTKLIITLTALLMLVGISAQAQTDNQTPASAESTDLEGDLNHDGKVDVADVTYLVNLIMKNKSEAKDGTYYWYIGVENPTTISDIQSDNTKPGWHEIGSSLSGFELDTDANPIVLSTVLTNTYMYYVIIPNELNMYDADGASMLYSFISVECNIPGYKAYQYDTPVRRVRGVYIKEGTSNESNNDNFYWYIGVDNPASISNIQTDNTVSGWHNIGSSLSGFEFSTSENQIVLYATDTRSSYYVVIPNELDIFDEDNASALYSFTSIECNISGYKAYKYNNQTRIVRGIIIKEGTSTESNNDNFYWYIGVDNPASISDIQTDNTVAGWHEIGESLDGFVHDMNNQGNWITLVENPTSTDQFVSYYVIIPNGVTFKDAVGSNLKTNGEYTLVDCNISGYEAYKYNNTTSRVRGIIFEGYIPVSEVSISTLESSINVGNTLQLGATVSPSNATNQNVTWSSSNPAIATVDETTGLVTGVAVGSATITATSVDGGKTATTTVNVVETLSGYYWYIGTTLPSSISDIQTDPTKQGWHSIGTSLSGFMHDMNENTNRITLVERPTSWDDFVYYYVIIPNGITFRDAVGSNLKTNGEYDRVECNISGYEAYISTDTSSKVQGLIFEGPVD